MQRFEGIAFLAPLADAMTKHDAKDRPDVFECIQLLEGLVQQQPPRDLLRLLVWKRANAVTRAMRNFGSFRRGLAYTARGYLRSCFL